VHAMPVQIVGGIGLFLLGMILLTEGIKAVAGDSLRKTLMRLTGHPMRAFMSGVLVTVVVQSSSATTVTVIGFVSAGLMSFSQAVNVVIGASLGTTATGWFVSVLGLKFSLGAYALPLVAIGAVLRLVGSRRWRVAGLPLCGFGLIFVGIETLQVGMAGFAQDFNIAPTDSTGLIAHVLLMLSGVVLTVVTQSSSAAMATILTALHTGSIAFDQAASLAIGAAIGTTVTSVIAAIGASVSARRTAAAHVIFNLFAGFIAVVLLPVFLKAIQWAQLTLDLPPGAVSLAAFHTAFIGLGVVLFMPFVGLISRWIEHLIPDDQTPLARHLDDSLLGVPEVAMEATRRALRATAAELFDATRSRLAWGNRGYHDSGSPRVHTAILKIQTFLGRIHHLPGDRPMSSLHVAQIHVIDHLLRMEESMQSPRAQLEHLNDPSLRAVIAQTAEILRLAGAGLRGEEAEGWIDRVRAQSEGLAELRRHDRPLVMQATAFGELDSDKGLMLLDTMRWLDRIGYHTWRIAHYLHGDAAEIPWSTQGDRVSGETDALDEPSSSQTHHT